LFVRKTWDVGASTQSRYDSHHLISLETITFRICPILRTMKIPSLNPQQNRAAGALLGALIGDAIGLGPHWYYDLDVVSPTKKGRLPQLVVSGEFCIFDLTD
jgi:hypothetical protein